MSTQPTMIPDPTYYAAKKALEFAEYDAEQGCPVSELADLTKARAEIDRIIAQRVAALRTAGESWTTIAAGLGVTKQAAQQRYGR